MKTSTKTMVMCAVCTALICVLAPIAVPIGPVPISLSTFAIMLSAALLGGKAGTAATALYLLIGAAGVPVFAGYSAGLAKLAGPTGGYLVGYLALAAIEGAIYFRFGKKRKGAAKYAVLLGGMILGTVVLYAIGTAWFCVLMHTGLVEALGMCVIPFLPGDAMKMIVIALLVPQLEKGLARAGVQAAQNS